MKVLLCPIASPGFVYSAIGVALALKERGHEVAFATDQSYTVLLDGAGLHRLPRGQRDGSSFDITQWAHPIASAIQTKHVEYAIQHWQPDVVVTSQLALGPLIAAERHAIPVAVLGLAVYLWPSTLNNQLDDHWRYQEIGRAFNQTRAMFGLPALSIGQTNPFVGDMLLLQTVAELEGSTADLPPNTHLLGACSWSPAQSDSDFSAWVNASDPTLPLIYVQPSRAFALPTFFPELVDLAHNQGWRLVASVGRSEDSSIFKSARIYIQPHIDQHLVLPHAALVIGSGTTTLMLGALQHGLPLVLLPGGGEQALIAQRCAAAGVATVLPVAELSVTRLAQAIKTVLHDSHVRDRAEQVRHSLLAAPGCGGAATQIETLARTNPCTAVLRSP